MSDDSRSNHLPAVEVPQTAEGWYVLHDAWHLDWTAWRRRPLSERKAATDEAAQWLRLAAAAGGKGDSALYAVVGQKGDLLFVHYRESPAALLDVQLSFRRLALAANLRPAGSYLSVIEASLYEATAIAQWKLAEKGLKPGSPEFQEAFEREVAQQRKVLEARLFRQIPEARHICYYPMSKRRGEQHNWYAMPVDERRQLMRGHGKVGQKYAAQVTQVVSGSIGLDDWEWAVDLHAEDPLVFKKLVTEMRYDPASSRFAEFGPFWIGLRTAADELAAALLAE